MFRFSLTDKSKRGSEGLCSNRSTVGRGLESIPAGATEPGILREAMAFAGVLGLWLAGWFALAALLR